MPGFRLEEEDAISPVRITHSSEQIWNDDTLEQSYNYLDYEFETEQHLYRARSYLDETQTVAVYGPFDKISPGPNPTEGVDIDPRVVVYLRRRYLEITIPGPNEYVPLE